MNIDRLSNQAQSKYPFTDGSSLAISEQITFPIPAIQSLGLQISVPGICYFRQLKKNKNNTITVSIYNTAGKYYYFDIVCFQTAGIQTYSSFSVIRDQNNCPVGSVLYTDLLYKTLLAAITQENGQLLIPFSALQILPQCISIMKVQGFQTIAVNDNIRSIDTDLIFCDNIVYAQNSGIISAFGDVEFLHEDPVIDSIIIPSGTINVLNKQLIIKPGVISDLRVITTGQDIEIRGVGNE